MKSGDRLDGGKSGDGRPPLVIRSDGRDGAPGGKRGGPGGDLRGLDGKHGGPKGHRIDGAVGRGSHDSIGRARGFDPKRGVDYQHLTKGSVARGVHLDRQYDLYSKGDVARRLGMYDPKHGHGGPHHGPGGPHHGGPYPIHRGHISPIYTKSCFQFSMSFFGPSYYMSIGYGNGPMCWYPRWDPWVRWSWQWRCRPIWDPRPVWCRPVVYVPVQTWVYWDEPEWTPLPVVASGTWVDVGKQVVPPTLYDLQLLAVRFVDPGHPEEKLGPRYRVWVRNNSEEALSQPFDVFLFAGNDKNLTANLPRAGAKVTSIGANETMAVDIRLPFEAMQIGRDAQGKPAPFSNLHVLIDANRQIDEVTKMNNGAQLAADLVLPVDPAAFEIEPKTVRPGGQVLLAGEGLGPGPGKVLIHLGGIEMEAEILGWYDLGVRFTAPNLPLAGPTAAEVIVLRADGTAANPVTVNLDPTAPAVEAVPVPAPAVDPAAVQGPALAPPLNPASVKPALTP